MPETDNSVPAITIANSGLEFKNADRDELIPATETDCGLACCETCESPFCIHNP